MNLYTFGYRGRSFSDLSDHVVRGEHLVADIRFSPKSPWSPFWSRKNLKERFGSSYEHIRDLGNIQYRTHGVIEIADIKRGCERLEFFLNLGITPILLCACEEYDHCHRKVVAEYVCNKLGIESKEFRGESQHFQCD